MAWPVLLLAGEKLTEYVKSKVTFLLEESENIDGMCINMTQP